MTTASETIVALLKVGATHGVKGACKCYPINPASQHHLDDFSQWHIQRNGQWEPINNIAFSGSPEKRLITFPQTTSPEGAKYYVNTLLGISRHELPPLEPNEYYWSDLIGMQVIDTQGNPFGHVDQLIETGAHDVLIIKGPRPTLIPFVSTFIIDVNPTSQCITADWDPEYQ